MMEKGPWPASLSDACSIPFLLSGKNPFPSVSVELTEYGLRTSNILARVGVRLGCPGNRQELEPSCSCLLLVSQAHLNWSRRLSKYPVSSEHLFHGQPL